MHETRSPGAPNAPDPSGDATADRGRRRPWSRLRGVVAELERRVTAVLGGVWGDWRIGLAAGAASGVLWGLVAGWWTPRGPLTTAEAISAMVVSAAVGGVAGLVMRSRWALLVAPVAFTVAFELVRLDAVGPTVDGPEPASTYGLIALAVGRGFHGLVALAPMLVGAAAGAGWARRLHASVAPARGRAGTVALWARRTVAALTAVGLVVLALGIARPASTDPIVDADGEEIAGSVSELTTVEIGGRDLAMMVRGHSVDNPVLLFLAGGPGGTEMGAMRRHLPQLEQDFVVVTWDQRGTGKSYEEIEPTSTLTFEGAVADTIEVTDRLRDRFGQDRIYLMGQSYGSLLGVEAVQQRPDLYEAFIGTGQMVSPRETDRIFYEDTLAWARETGRDGLADELTDLGPPPYEDILDYEPVLSHEHDVYPYDRTNNVEGEGGFSENLFVEEYTLVEQVHNLGAFLDVFTILYPQIQGVDLREDATSLEVPVYLIQGGNEARGRAELAAEWFELLDAPDKDMAVLATAGHRPPWEQPDRFHEVMTDVVLAATSTGGGDDG